MGASGSVHTNHLNIEPECNTHETQQQPPTQMLQPEDITQSSTNNVTVLGEEQWLTQIQDLGKVIHDLARENKRLVNSNAEWKKKFEELQGQNNAKNACSCTESTNMSEQTINSLKEEAAKDKTWIEEVKLQLETKTENNAPELQKYHENIGFMKTKLKEYEKVVTKLEKDAASQNTAIQSLQNSIISLSNEKKTSEENISEMKDAFNKLEQKLSESQEENVSLFKQICEEKTSKESVIEENKKLVNELRQIKQIERENCIQRLSENSDVDISCEDDLGSSDFAATSVAGGSEAVKSEEPKTLSPRAVAELQVFQKQLMVKREARHKALSAISGEMERLRKELNSEREAKRSALKALEELKSNSSAHHMNDEVIYLKMMLSSESEAKEKLYKEMVQIQKQGNEEIENFVKRLDKEKENSCQTLKENKELKEQIEEIDQELQTRSEENTELQNKLETVKEKFQCQVAALKEVISLTKQMLSVRENQVSQLKNTIKEIEASVIQKHHGTLVADLKAEYETQIENIKALKNLYEERTQAMSAENEKLINEQNNLQKIIEEERNNVEDLELKLQEKTMLISERNSTVSSLQDQLSDALDQSRNLSCELTLINNMFTQILGSNDVDLDRLTKLLQENHDLMTEITTKGECSETTASLPKLLLDLVCDVEGAENKEKDDRKEERTDISCECTSETVENTVQDTSQQLPDEDSQGPEAVISVNGSGTTLAIQDISSNLPKVWRVLLELISHHVPSTTDESTEELKTSCYKSVDTPYGPKNVISVSKTFLRLKDLILQKKSLQKEVTRLKTLNVHLETKLSDQERRLSIVSTELRKTWNVVDHMRVQHQQLHTHEKVLRYELQQKRKLLNELKEELEYCKEKWDDARQKNSQSEIEWQKLRTEFALRKTKPNNNSGESGFSDEKEDDVSDVDVGKQHQPSYPAKSEDDTSKQGNVDTVNSTSSLPDLLSVTTDIPPSQSEVTSAVNVLSTNPHISENSLSNFQNLVQEALVFASDANKSTVVDSAVLDDCPTVSLITLLKQQLSFFSKNLDIITADFDANDHLKALQSIFALPAIEIPDHFNPSSSEVSSEDNESFENNSCQGSEICNPSCGMTVKVCGDSTDQINNQHFPCGFRGTNSTEEKKESEDIPKDFSNHSGTQEQNSMRTLQSENSSLATISPEESRSARIHRLEQQSKELFDKVTQGTVKSTGTDERNQTNIQEDSKASTRSLEDMLDARAARLKRLEEQSQQLFKKVKQTTHRSETLSNRLEELHEQYGSEETPTATTSTSFNPPVNNLPVPPPLPIQQSNPEKQVSQTNVVESSNRSLPSTSNMIPTPPPIEVILDARATRLKRLEEQSQQLFQKVKQTTHRSETLSNRLEELHEHYGSEETSTATTSLSLDSSSNNTSTSPSLPTQQLNGEKEVSHTVVASSSNMSLPSTSNRVPTPPIEEMLDKHAVRLKRLEEQSQQLFHKVKQTTQRSEHLSNRLEELHEQYGTDDTGENTVDETCVQSPNNAPVSTSLVGSDGLNHLPFDADNCGNISFPTTCVSVPLSSIPVSPASSSFTLTDACPPENESTVIIEENGSYPSSYNIPRPPPLPTTLPVVRLPTETNHETTLTNPLQRIQNLEEDPT